MTTPSWQADALQDLENSSLSVGEIALKYNRSEVTIRKLLQRSEIVRRKPSTQKGPRRRENSQPISRQHHAIGIRLNMARGPMGSKQFADKLGVSPIVLAQMEVGQHDFRLSQLHRISEVTGQSIQTLMQTFENNLYQGRPHARN